MREFVEEELRRRQTDFLHHAHCDLVMLIGLLRKMDLQPVADRIAQQVRQFPDQWYVFQPPW